ncbi:MAG: ATP-dependent helicase [Magnetococcales bacterium]|nr:ATP-dependent helicase [Magnetococcales bacterium]
MNTSIELNPAEEVSVKAINKLIECLDSKKNFIFEAGAGAGKTYSLVIALKHLIREGRTSLQRNNQKIACISYTNIAKNEIDKKTDNDPLIYSDTIHGFCWSLINGFHEKMIRIIKKDNKWKERIAKFGNVDGFQVKYLTGHPKIYDNTTSLRHDDVIIVMSEMLSSKKFRKLVTAKFPVVLIDEYQDTEKILMESILSNFFTENDGLLFGFFGDSWQKIYGTGCGKVSHDSLITIEKGANFRSVSTIVDCLNRMRPGLTQQVKDPSNAGKIHVYQTNDWLGKRRGGGHWKGDLPQEEAHNALEKTKELLSGHGWDFSPDETKILMLTHGVLAAKQGYGNIKNIFIYPDSFTKKQDQHIEYFVDTLEPICQFYIEKDYGNMFTCLGEDALQIRQYSDKKKWADSMNVLIDLRLTGTVHAVIKHLQDTQCPRLPHVIEQRESCLNEVQLNGSMQESSKSIKELNELHKVKYKEVIALSKFLNGCTPFSTKHGVKGEQYENVLVVVGRGWNKYNFNKMLEQYNDIDGLSGSDLEFFERNRNLFYVACSRPKRRLAILFTQEISGKAMKTLESWFGKDNIQSVDFALD